MDTWGAFRALSIRPLLKDTADEPRWSDAELLVYANWGLADLSLVCSQVASLTFTGSGPVYELPADLLALQHLTVLEQGQTIFVAPLYPGPGQLWDFTAPTLTSEPFGYVTDWPIQGYLTLTQLKPAGTVTLVYTIWLPSLTEDATMLPFGSRRWAVQALACYICYCAHLREGVGRAGLEQWSQRPDIQVGNPLNLEAAEWLKAYTRLVMAHKDRGR